jgi:hypothetical protein
MKRYLIATMIATTLTAAALTPTSANPTVVTPTSYEGVPGNVQTMLNHLKVKKESHIPYSRAKFVHWASAGNSCDVRDLVLLSEGQNVVVGDSCAIQSGQWRSSYDNIVTAIPSQFDIDHMVPLKEAWQSGAAWWTKGKRKRYANDLGYPGSLVAVTAQSNRSKSDQSPNEWLPAYDECQYMATWVAVKYRWSLSVDAKEMKFLQTNLPNCGYRAEIATPEKAR